MIEWTVFPATKDEACLVEIKTGNSNRFSFYVQQHEADTIADELETLASIVRESR